MKINNESITICDECKSEFYKTSSLMEHLCPECAHVLYDYENCDHEFINKRCKRCYWNGNSSKYINELKFKKS